MSPPGPVLARGGWALWRGMVRAARSGARAASRSAVAAPAGPEPTMMTSRRSTQALLAPGDSGRHRPSARLDSSDPARDNHSNASPARAACSLRPRGRPPRRLERRREPGAAHPVGGPLLSAGEAVPTRAGAHHRALLLRARGGAGRGHDRPAGEGPYGGHLDDRGRTERPAGGVGTAPPPARRAHAAALPALPPALHARPLSSSPAAYR